MAEMFLSPPISTLMEKANDPLVKEFTILIGAQRDLQKLYGSLQTVQAIAVDAEERSRANQAVRAWMRLLEAAAYEAGDVLDELRYDAIIKAVETKKKVPFSVFLPGVSLIWDATRSRSYGEKLKGVMEKVDSLIAEMDRFKILKTKQPFTTTIDLPKRHHSYVTKSTIIGSSCLPLQKQTIIGGSCQPLQKQTIIGRSVELEKIFGMILGQDERESVAVISILGMGGVGKTTLAQLVYNSEKIQEHFELKLWVCVPVEFRVNHIAKSIIDLAIGQDSKVPLYNTELVSQRLREELGGKRYILVLDDVWNEEQGMWEQLKLLLDYGDPGSVVIVTSRSIRVAWMFGTTSVCHLETLSEKDSWALFRQKAFPIGDYERPQLVLGIGRELLHRMCRGIPLEIILLGGLMSYKKEVSEWLDVLESDNLVVEDHIMPVLKLSYENLPSHMKRCFAFCAVHPKDFVMERDTLIQLWMANSYIPSEGSMEMEDKGIEIFNELAWRGFFQDIKETSWGVVECKMHGLIHDLAQSLVGTRCVSLPYSVQQSEVLLKETIHVSSLSTRSTIFLLKEHSSRSLHTILSLSHSFCSDEIPVSPLDLSEVKSCRALSLREIPLKNILDNVGKLKHLRYLNLSHCSLLKALPESLCTIYSLQTLNLSHCTQLKCLPKDMRYMYSLRHVFLEGCYQLEKMPAGLGELRYVQTLTMYLVDPGISCGIEELKDLNLGGRLELYDLFKLDKVEDARKANLVSKRKLMQLHLSWGSVQSVLTESDVLNAAESNPDTAREILQGLEPNERLEILEIRQYNGILFSAWMYDSRVLKYLNELILVECVRCETLPPICQLPSLKKLILIRLYRLKHVCSDGALLASGGNLVQQRFPALEHLSLADLPSLESWLENDPAKEELTSLLLSQLAQRGKVYPGLESLELSDTESLESWPEIDAEMLTSLAFLQLHELIILRCPKLDALPSCPSLRVLEIAGETSIPSSLIELFENKGVHVK